MLGRVKLQAEVALKGRGFQPRRKSSQLNAGFSR
jgi:hypothetical protein